MSGYEGGGTDMSGDGYDGGGNEDADVGNQLAGTFGAQTSLSNAQDAAAMTSAVGANAFGNSNLAGATLGDLTQTVSTATATSVLSVVQTAIKGALAVLGVVSGTPTGVLSGSLSISNMLSGPSQPAASVEFADSAEFGFGYAGGASGGSFSGSSAPDLFAGSGPDQSVLVTGSPVMGFSGAPVNASTTAPAGAMAGYGLNLFPVAGSAGRGSLVSPAGFVAGGSGASASLPIATLIAIATAIFWGA